MSDETPVVPETPAPEPTLVPVVPPPTTVVVVEPPKDCGVDNEPQRPKVHIFRALGAGIINIIMFVPNLFRHGRRNRNLDEVTVYSAHPAFYLWFLILSGFVLSAVVHAFPGLTHTVGWIYVWCLVYFVLTLLYDFSVKKLSLWLGIICLLWLLSKYIEHLQNVAVLGAIVTYLSNLNPVMEPGTATVLSWLFLLPWIFSLVEMFLNRRKRFTPNEIGEFHFGEGVELTDRYGLRFRTKYRDVLEFLLTFGGGDLLAVDNHGNVVKRYENIVGLWFLWDRLDKTLQQRSTVAQLEDAPADGDQ